MDKRERDTMKKKNLQRKQRLLAVVLSVMLFAGLLPGSLSQVLAASDEYEAVLRKLRVMSRMEFMKAKR